jgi:hypothetical protein
VSFLKVSIEELRKDTVKALRLAIDNFKLEGDKNE